MTGRTTRADTAEGSTGELYDRLQEFVGLSLGQGSTSRDPVNQPMIRHWCDAMGDANPPYTDPRQAAASVHREIVAPPTMLQVWNMPGLARRPSSEGNQDGLMAVLDGAGYTSVVATNCDQHYHRYLRPGDVLTEDAVVESVSTLKTTALGEGFFITTRRSYRDQAGDLVGEMRFRILKFRPADGARDGENAPVVASDAWPHPAVNRDTEFFWEGTRQRELRIQRCASCSRLRHPPTPYCPSCNSAKRDWVIAEGVGTVYSFVVHHHPPVPPLELPFVVAVVELPEGTRIVGNVLGVETGTVKIGLPVEVTFVQIDDELVLPQWRPRAGGKADA